MVEFAHIPVLYRETLEALAPVDGGVYADFTLGGGGHAQGVLEASGPSGALHAFDRDPRAIAASRARLAPFGERATLRQARMSDAVQVVCDGVGRERGGFSGCDGVLADLGVSSPQLDDASRGFSFRNDAPLDMRMGEGETAAEYLDRVDVDELARAFRQYGEIRGAKRLARAVKEDRAKGTINTTGELAGLCERVLGRARKHHPATLAFQAIRIAVNQELDELQALLDAVPEMLNGGGVAAVISFHSLEDRMVKRAFRALVTVDAPRGLPVPETQAPFEWVTMSCAASAEELERNPRARTARLRAVRRRPLEVV